MSRKCSVPRCKVKNVTLFSAPIDSERLMLWKKQIGASGNSFVVCEKHFEKRFLTFNDSGTTVLANYAVPTLHLPAKEDQTDTLKKIESIEEKSKCNTLIKGASRLAITLHECQKQVKKESERKNYYEGLSLRIYMSNPQAYKKFCSNLNFIPFEELKKILIAKVNSFEKDILLQRLLAMKMKTMIENNRQFYICVEEINLNPKYYYHIKRDLILGIHNIGKALKPRPATAAIVLTLHGISDEWKQCICIAYVDDSTDYFQVWQWISRCIGEIALRTGFHIMAVVYKGDSKYFNKDIQADKPYIMLNIPQQEKVHYICEATSLLKMFYHNLMTYGYYDAHNELASKQGFLDYIQLNEIGKSKTFNISEEHLQPDTISLDGIKEVISYDVAARILFYSDSGILDTYTAAATAKLVMSVIKLINVLNPKVLGAKNKVGITISFLHIALQIFSSLHLKTNGKTKPRDDFVENVKITINSILSMHEKMKSRNNSTFSPFFQQPYTFNYFQTIFDKVLSEQKHLAPTAKTVDLVFRQILVRDLLQPTNKYTNIDLERFVTDIQNVFNSDPKSYSISPDTPIVHHTIVQEDYRMLKLGDNPLKELSNFLLVKAKAVPHQSHHNCKSWKTNSDDTESGENCMVIYVKKMEETFKLLMSLDTFEWQNEMVLSSLLSAFESKDDIHRPCECIPKLFVRTLYLRFRIYHILKKNNMLLKTSSDSKRPLLLDL